jgi:hypothetical protein
MKSLLLQAHCIAYAYARRRQHIIKMYTERQASTVMITQAALLLPYL